MSFALALSCFYRTQLLRFHHGFLGCPPSPSFQRKSFSELFDASAQLALRICASSSTHRGEPAINFSQANLVRLAAPFKFALVGKFSRGRPSMDEARKFFRSLDLRDEASIGLLDQRHLIIRLVNEADYHRLWSRGLWYVQNYPMRVFKWSPAFHVDREPSVAPVWV